MNEYVRLFERFQRLRPEDGPDEIDRLIALVENGTLKERDGNFIVTPPRDGDANEELSEFLFGGGELTWIGWEPSSHNTARIPAAKFVDGYFSVPQKGSFGQMGHGFIISETDIPRGFSLSGPHVPWMGPVQNMDGNFRFKVFLVSD